MVTWRSLSHRNTSYETAGFVDLPGSVHRLVVSLIGRGETVLEVGCSTGYISDRLKLQKQCNVVGIEVDAKAADEARHRVGIPVFVPQGELPDLPPEYVGHFDVVLCADVVEHVHDPLQFIEHLKTYASPRGRFIFSIPNIAHWTCRLHLLQGKWQYTSWGLLDYTHLRFFTFDSFVQLIAETGLHVTSVHSSCGPIEMYEFLSRRGLRRCRAGFFRLFRYLSDQFPRLFALQFVVEARLD